MIPMESNRNHSLGVITMRSNRIHTATIHASRLDIDIYKDQRVSIGIYAGNMVYCDRIIK